MMANLGERTGCIAVRADPPARILVVDDEIFIGELLTTILLPHGYRVSVAIDGVEAISTAQREHPALIILDYLMPGMDGIIVCRMLKEGHTTRQIKVIMLTGVLDEITQQRALVAGVDGYLTKPFSQSDLLEMIDGVLGSTAD